MVTTRTPIGRPLKSRITPEILAVYKRARDYDDDGDAAQELHVLLRRQPWQACIMFVNDDGSPPEFTRSEEAWHAEDRKQALEIRRARARIKIKTRTRATTRDLARTDRYCGFGQAQRVD